MDIQKVNNIIREETVKAFQDQGHHLTGGWENALKIIEKNVVNRWIVEVWGAGYTGYVNYKMPGSKASMKMFWFVKKYVQARIIKVSIGDEKRAGGIAAMIIRKWMKEGRPTTKSRDFSKTGKRTEFIEQTISVLSQKLIPFFADNLKSDIEKLITNEIKLINAI